VGETQLPSYGKTTLALTLKKVILQPMAHPGRSNREAYQTGRCCCEGSKRKIAKGEDLKIVTS
jgi:hypothetical protein